MKRFGFCDRVVELFLLIYFVLFCATHLSMIIFDLDGTLIDSEAFLKEIEAELKCELGFDITFEEQASRFGGIGPYQQLELDSKLPKHFAPEAEKRFRELAPGRLKCCSGVDDFLESCEEKTVIASNGPLEWIVSALQVTGLDHFFSNQELFHVDMVKNKKPAPDLFLLAAREASLRESVTVVEDSIVGVQAGLAAGFKTLGYVGANRNPEMISEEMKQLGAESLFHHYSELSDLLK